MDGSIGHGCDACTGQCGVLLCTVAAGRVYRRHCYWCLFCAGARAGCSMAFLMRVNWAFRGFNRSHHVPLFGDATMPVSRTWLSQGHYMVPCDTICASLYVFFLQRTYLRSLSLTLSYLQVDTVNDVWKYSADTVNDVWKFIGLFNSCLKWFSLRWSTVLETPRLWHLARISTRFSTV